MSFGLYGRRMIKSDETEVTVENVVAILNKHFLITGRIAVKFNICGTTTEDYSRFSTVRNRFVQRFVIKSWRTGRMRLCPSSLAI